MMLLMYDKIQNHWTNGRCSAENGWGGSNGGGWDADSWCSKSCDWCNTVGCLWCSNCLEHWCRLHKLGWGNCLNNCWRSLDNGWCSYSFNNLRGSNRFDDLWRLDSLNHLWGHLDS